MSAKILETNCFVTLLGGGEASNRDIAEAIDLAPVLVAADRGADRALAANVVPDAVIGDMDSISDDALKAVPKDRINRITEQDSTDFDKCLRSVSAPLILAVGFTGSRIDHQLAVLSSMVQWPGRPCIVIGETDIVFHCPAEFAIDLPVGTRVSLFPMRPVRGASRGLHWPIDGLELTPGGVIGTSNRSDEPTVTLRPGGDGLLVILPRATLPQAIAALAPAS